MAETIGFIGLGAMGGGMAANLLKAGFALVVNDIDAAKVQALVARGAKSAATPAESTMRSSPAWEDAALIAASPTGDLQMFPAHTTRTDWLIARRRRPSPPLSVAAPARCTRGRCHIRRSGARS